MSSQKENNMADEINYQEREAVAVFSDEASLNAAVDELMQLGLRQEDMSLLASTDKLPSGISTDKLEDADNVPHAAYVSPIPAPKASLHWWAVLLSWLASARQQSSEQAVQRLFQPFA